MIDPGGGRGAKFRSVTIGFPVKCTYRGGHTALGPHGRHLRIEDGTIGHGELRLTHGIPLSVVTRVDVVEYQFEGSEAKTLLGLGATGRGHSPASEPEQVTEITVRTRDGHHLCGRWSTEGPIGFWND